jgi:lipoprotein-anchoring transpeptidase ErfK/SrfK
MSESFPCPRPLRPTALLLFAAWLLGTAGCAQMTFPQLPPGLIALPAADAGDEGAGADDDPETGAAATAETVDAPAADDLPELEETTPGKLFDWQGDGRELTRIVIDTDAQTAHFYAGAERVGWTTIASGVSSHPTPRGEFAVLEKVRDKRSNLYGKIVGRNGQVIRGNAHGKDPVPRGARFVGASMPNFMRLTYDGIGMHAGPIPRPGQPASHGCIRMPPQMAAAVFEHTSNGTAVTVIGNGPDYGNYAERIARQQAEERARRAAAVAAAEGTALDALDAEIEAMNAAGAGSTAPAPATETAPSETAEADAARSEAAAGSDSAATPSPAQATSQRPDADAGRETRTTERPPDAADTPPAATERARKESGPSADSRVSAEAEAATTPTRQRDAGQPRAAEPDTIPAEPPDEPTQRTQPDPGDYYGPPAPPPTMRSAGTRSAPRPMQV